ncbi:efflux RND transporter periplasmic adaptor subunit [Ramlibacter humi]|uniref:Efflux RND transporter periplasmic adaptor subunit n=1 Tax=Ramlibacter humi TaxID=2530451 RepID=A0A4Z0BVD9_9BURK|nr:efflux RND transporter periplasmic adaptor subunit [Ramlibacter humi]TFZ01995.1 efflux RND transporter periplasmic adaptor subunit [Ramlibacter humi]
MKLSRPKIVALVALAVAIVIGAVVALRGSKQDAAKKDEKAAGAKPALTVATTVPQRVPLPVRLSANGNIAAWQEASIGAEAGGLRITEVRVNVGDRVEKGQVLATFATDTLKADLGQAKAALAEADAAAADAAANAERARSLQQTGALSASQINQYLTAEKTAQARVQAARAAFDVQQVRLTQSLVVAPDAGMISARTATVGQVVANGTELFRLIRQGRLEWRAEVTSAELGKLAPGTTASVTAASGARLAGRVRTLGASVDPQTRTAIVYVDLTPLPGAANASARAGMFARGDFELGSTPALTIPQSALVLREGFSYVLRVNDDQRVSQVKVQPGRMAGDRVEIGEGLPAGARIVASGGSFLNDGDLVRVADTAPAPAAAASRASAAKPAASR